MNTESWAQVMLGWIHANPGWGAAIIFSVSAVESLVLIGILLPGIMILFGIGALIGLGLLDFTTVWIAASAGAWVGDSLSYALGYRYREHLLDIWPFSRYPGLMERGIAFVQAHGPKSVVAGRFIGPLRPVIPAVVGIMGMRPARFFAADVAACIAWAPAFLVPGVLFGASLEIASEYAGRLTTLLVVALFALWLTWWLMRAIYEPLASRSARWLRHAIRWTRRHPVLGRLLDPLVDPAQPEVLSVSVLGLLLLVIFWCLGMLLLLSPFAAQPQSLDQAVASLALSLRNQLADPFMVAIAQLARWQVSLVAAAAVLLWLFLTRRAVAALHWFAAVCGGWVIQIVLDFALRAAHAEVQGTAMLPGGPSPALVGSTVLFSFFAVMIAREVERRHRQWPYLAAGLVLTLLILARLYLGLERFSVVMMGLLLGIAWTLVIGIAYRQRAMRPFRGAMACLVFYGSVLLAFAWQVREHTAADVAALQQGMPQHSMSADAWWTSGWRELPAHRTGRYTIASRRFNVQVAVDAERIAELLAAAGWERVPGADWRWIVQALNPEPDTASLPLLGRAFEGHSEVLLMQSQDSASGRRITFRLWDSGWRLKPGDGPLLLGQVAEERLVQRLGLFSYWQAEPLDAAGLRGAREALGALQQQSVTDGLLLIR